MRKPLHYSSKLGKNELYLFSVSCFSSVIFLSEKILFIPKVTIKISVSVEILSYVIPVVIWVSEKDAIVRMKYYINILFDSLRISLLLELSEFIHR